MTWPFHTLLSISFILCTSCTSCINSTEATVISCQDNVCEEHEKVIGAKCCKYENLLSDELEYKNVAIITNVKYTQHTRYTLDIQQFIISKSNISQIPQNLFQNINQIKYLDVINSGVSNIRINDFLNAYQLVHLNLTNNSIKYLEPKLFVHAANLLIIDLTFNQLDQVSEYAFDHLDVLKKLILSNNKLITFDSKFEFLNLETFLIDFNLLTEFGESIFQNSTKLRELNLRNNNLKLESLHLPNYVFLDVFDISNNLASISLNSKNISIQNTSTETYFINRNVQILDASNNQISSLHVDNGAKLIHLNLSKNNLSSIKNVTNLNSLLYLDLSFNSIKDFSISSFSEMNDLQILNLKNSGLASLDFGTFSQQTNLSFLDISDNNLININFDTLSFLSSLSILYIDGNQLANVNVSDIKTILPNLSIINISNNLFKCNDLMSIMKLLYSCHIEIHIVKEMLVKDKSNIRGIRCFSNLSDNNLSTNRKNTFQLTENYASNLDLRRLDGKINELNLKLQNDLIELQNTMSSIKNQSLTIENRLNKKIKNLTFFSNDEHTQSYSINESSNISTELDSWNFLFIFLIVTFVLVVFSVSSYLFIKYRLSGRRWYTAAKQSNTNIDQTSV